MTFAEFEKVIKERAPRVDSVSECGNGDICALIGGEARYFCGDLVWVLGMLGVRTCIRSDLESAREYLKRQEAVNGQRDFFGEIIDNESEIKCFREYVAGLESAYIID